MDRANYERARLLQIECEMQGMIALNTYRTTRGETIAYDDDAFMEIVNRIQELIDG